MPNKFQKELDIKKTIENIFNNKYSKIRLKSNLPNSHHFKLAYNSKNHFLRRSCFKDIFL